MKQYYDLPPALFSEFRHRPVLYRAARGNGPAGVLGPLYLLWRGEWQQCCRIYLPVLAVFAVSFGLMGYGMGARSVGWIQAGTVTACLCMVWGFVRNLQLDLFWNDRPHPRQRAWPLSLLWLTAAIGLPMLAMELGGLLGAR